MKINYLLLLAFLFSFRPLISQNKIQARTLIKYGLCTNPSFGLECLFNKNVGLEFTASLPTPKIKQISYSNCDYHTISPGNFGYNYGTLNRYGFVLGIVMSRVQANKMIHGKKSENRHSHALEFSIREFRYAFYIENCYSGPPFEEFSQQLKFISAQYRYQYEILTGSAINPTIFCSFGGAYVFQKEEELYANSRIPAFKYFEFGKFQFDIGLKLFFRFKRS